LPIPMAQGINSGLMRRLAFGIQHPRNQRIHVVMNGRENRLRRIVQGIVQIEQPGQLRQ
jgi:hypothetical protein